MADQSLQHRVTGLLAHTNRCSHGRRDQGRIIHRGQTGERDSLAVKLEGGGSNLYRQAGLADAGGAHQRDETGTVKQLRHGRHLFAPADEAAEECRQVMSHVSCAHGESCE